MAREKVTIWKYICERCQHDWIPRDVGNEPKVCPKCKSPYWDTPKKITAKKQAKIAVNP
jgi:rRNA maturation endonuclease Nob1